MTPGSAMTEVDAAMASVITDYYGRDVTASMAVDKDSAGYVLTVSKRVLIPDLNLDDSDSMADRLFEAIDSVLKETPAP